MKEKEPQNKTEAVAESLKRLVADIGLGSKVTITVEPTRNSGSQIAFTSHKTVRAAWGSGLKSLEDGQYALFVKFLARSIAPTGVSVNSLKLLKRQAFITSLATEANLNGEVKGNFLLNSLTSEGALPCFYGSTSGLNFAELLETVICAEFLEEKGASSYVLFDTVGHDTEKANDILLESMNAIPGKMKAEFSEFFQSLGMTAGEKRKKAARILLPDKKIHFIETEEISALLSENFKVGKLLVLAKMAGEDPTLFKGIKTSDLLAGINQTKEGPKILKTSVTDLELEPSGFTYYAREAVIAAEFDGVVAFPFKLTTHANIYKILEGFDSLYSNEKGKGAILCPIQRQRVQTKTQSGIGADPVDVTVLAFLATKFPNEFKKLTSDFANSCRVLSPKEAERVGTKDKRFIVEDYFPIK